MKDIHGVVIPDLSSVWLELATRREAHVKAIYVSANIVSVTIYRYGCVDKDIFL